jgi:hypothetical protein
VSSAPVAATPVKIDLILRLAWSLFSRDPIVALPMLVFVFAIVVMFGGLTVGLVMAVFSAAAHHQKGPPANLIPLGVAAGVAWVLAFVLQPLVYTAVYGLADAAWMRDSATAADAFSAIRQRWVATYVAVVGYLALGFAAVILTIPTLGLVWFAFPVFTMYVFPAVVAGRRSGIDAIVESIRLVRHKLAISALATLILFAIQYAASFVVFPFLVPMQFAIMTSTANGQQGLPHLEAWQFALAAAGYILLFALICASMGFNALVQTGLYRALQPIGDTPSTALAAPPGPEGPA